MRDPDNKCSLCPVGYIRTEILSARKNREHIHDFCDGCSYRMCTSVIPCQFAGSLN